MSLESIQETSQVDTSTLINESWHFKNGKIEFYYNGSFMDIKKAIKLNKYPPNYNKLHVSINDENLYILSHNGFEYLSKHHKNKFTPKFLQTTCENYNLMKSNQWFKNYLNEDMIPLELLWEDYITYYDNLYIYNNNLYTFKETYILIDLNQFPLKKILDQFYQLYYSGWTTKYRDLIRFTIACNLFYQYNNRRLT